MSNIIGLGLDATDIKRIAATIERYGDRFVARIFTAGEIAYSRRRREPAIHFAGRFAAKEAAMKALGTGHSRGVLWRDVEVRPSRRPAATAVSRRGRTPFQGDGRPFVVADHHAFRGSRHGPGDDSG